MSSKTGVFKIALNFDGKLVVENAVYSDRKSAEENLRGYRRAVLLEVDLPEEAYAQFCLMEMEEEADSARRIILHSRPLPWNPPAGWRVCEEDLPK